MAVSEDDSGPAPAPMLEVRQVEHDDGVVLEVIGDVDMATAPRLQGAFDRLLRHDQSLLVVDLDGVTFLGSVGLSMLLKAHASAGPGRLRVVAATRASRRAIEVTALDQVLAMFPTLRAALDTHTVEG